MLPVIESYEVLIIGGGKAGKTLAVDLAKSGKRVALVERGLIGGSCINLACIPTKALVLSARVAHLARHAADFGVHTGAVSIDLPAIRQRKHAIVQAMVELNAQNLRDALHENFIIGQAAFTAPRTVDVTLPDGSLRTLTGDRLFLNLGTRPDLPSIPGLAAAQPLNSESIQELDAVPPHLLILGGGPVGLEFAQMFRRFGSQVTLVQRHAQLAPREDQDAADAILHLLQSEGIAVHLATTLASVEGVSGQTLRAQFTSPTGPKTLDATHLLVATGRIPNTDHLGLDKAGVTLTPQGFILVNERLETAAPNTWALGDCAGTPQFTHASLDDYRIVKANIFANGTRTTTDRLIPHTIFLDPEFARVGLTESDTHAKPIPHRLVKIPVASVPRARTLSETTGFLKALLDPTTHQILGFAMLGPHAAEVASVVQTAMRANLPYTALRDSLLAHPTMSESLNLLLTA